MTGPKPQGPTHPTPTGPPKDDVFSLAASLGEDVAIDSGRGAAGELSSRPVFKTPARPDPSETGSWKAGGPVHSSRAGAGEPLPVSAVAAGGRSGGVEAAPGPGFLLPVPVGPPRFEVPSRPGTPGLPPPQPSPQPGPVPHPPPPVRFVLRRFQAASLRRLLDRAPLPPQS